MSAPARAGLPLWPLPLLIALAALLAVHAAYWLSIRDGYVPACVPYWDGCTSISRAARHGLGNDLFRAVMLPCALLQGLHWLAARAWLRRHHPTDTAGRSLVVLGLLAALALAVYATYLGSDGAVYRWLRRYGVVLYFAFTYLAQLVVARRLRELTPAHAGIQRTMLALGLLLLGIGLASIATAALAADPLKERLDNALEWWLGLLCYGWFVAQALLWRRTGFTLRAARAAAVS